MSEALVTSPLSLAAADAEWDDLAARTHASPFQYPGWIARWWSAFGKGALEVRAVRRRRDGALAALVPVRVHQGALTSPTNWHTGDFGVLCDGDEACIVLLDALFCERRRRLSLAFLRPEQAALFKRRALEAGYRVIERTAQRSPYVTIDRTWNEYERSLPAKMRSDLKRRHKLLARRGAVSFEVTCGERLDDELEQGFAIEASGWKGMAGSAIRAVPAVRRFYTDVARWAAFRGWLRLAFLKLDGRAIAFDFALEHGGVHYLLKTGYAAELRQLSPGKLLRQAMLRRAFESGLRSYEFLGADEPWKLEWTETTRPRCVVQGFRRTPAGVVDWSAFAYGRPLAKKVRDLVRNAR